MVNWDGVTLFLNLKCFLPYFHLHSREHWLDKRCFLRSDTFRWCIKRPTASPTTSLSLFIAFPEQAYKTTASGTLALAHPSYAKISQGDFRFKVLKLNIVWVFKLTVGDVMFITLTRYCAFVWLIYVAALLHVLKVLHRAQLQKLGNLSAANAIGQCSL